MRNLYKMLLLGLLAGCQLSGAPQESVAAVIIEPDAAGRTEIQRIISEALGQREVRLADDVLQANNQLIISQVLLQNSQGELLNGRADGLPEHFFLHKTGYGCELSHRQSGRRWLLKGVRCAPIGEN